MKKLLTLALSIVMLVVFAELSAAQQKGEQKSPSTGVETRQRAKNWSPSHRYFCWDNQGTGFWSDVYLPGPVFFCVGPYNRRPDSNPTMATQKQAQDCQKAGGVWDPDGKGGCTRPVK